MPKHKKGFTLLELLVVMAVIAMAFAITTVSLSNVRKKTRDTQRVTDMNSLSKALNIFYTSEYEFPVYTGNITGSDAMSTALLNAKSITAIPRDPAGNIYTYTSANGTTFELKWCMETDEVPGYKKGCDNKITP